MLPAHKDYSKKPKVQNLDIIVEDEENDQGQNSDAKKESITHPTPTTQPIIEPHKEIYPFRKPKTYPEVLLVSYSSIKSVLETKIGFKSVDVQMEEAAVTTIKKALQNKQ